MGGFRTAWMAVACAIVVSGCARETPEVRLRQTLDAMQHAVETRDAGQLMEHVAEDFVGPDGADRASLRRTAQAAFLRHGRVGLALGPVDLTLAPDGRHAQASFTAAVHGSEGAPLDGSFNVYQVRSGWRLADGEWELTSLQWSGLR